MIRVRLQYLKPFKCEEIKLLVLIIREAIWLFVNKTISVINTWNYWVEYKQKLLPTNYSFTNHVFNIYLYIGFGIR